MFSESCPRAWLDVMVGGQLSQKYKEEVIDAEALWLRFPGDQGSNSPERAGDITSLTKAYAVMFSSKGADLRGTQSTPIFLNPLSPYFQALLNPRNSHRFTYSLCIQIASFHDIRMFFGFETYKMKTHITCIKDCHESLGILNLKMYV